MLQGRKNKSSKKIVLKITMSMTTRVSVANLGNPCKLLRKLVFRELSRSAAGKSKTLLPLWN